jgi:acyl-[acyl-carrier-protein]-phospholipid O-acyltransferase/long-chain-fatty-acid--[acyl-carrier-protein] ligase
MNASQKKSFWALMVTQFFGAFNDNVLKTLIALLIVQWIEDDVLQSQLVDISGIVFVAPFLIFSMVAGRLADRVGKPRVIVATKFWELLVLAATILALWAKSIPFLMVALFMLSMQAAFFSPAKYGVVPELMGEAEISRGNGWLNMGTFAAILLGTITGSFLSMNLILASGVMLAASVIGLAASQFMEPRPAAKPNETWAWDPLRDLIENWKLISRDPTLRMTAIAVNYFWFVGAVFQINIFLYAKQMMGVSDKVTGLLMASLMVGIVLGSLLAGLISGKHVELGLVPFGLLGISLFGMDLLWAYTSLYRLIIDLFMMGFSAGFYDIPMTALLQWRSPPGERGRVLATVNFLSFVAILSGSASLWLLHTFTDLNPAQVFGSLGFVSLIGLGFLYRLFPEPYQRAWAILRRQRIPNLTH